jgi:hypothetical protein
MTKKVFFTFPDGEEVVSLIKWDPKTDSFKFKLTILKPDDTSWADFPELIQTNEMISKEIEKLAKSRKKRKK